MADVPVNPSVMREARDAAFAEVYSIERQRFSDAEWSKIEPLLWRAFNSIQRQFLLRCEVKERGTE